MAPGEHMLSAWLLEGLRHRRALKNPVHDRRPTPHDATVRGGERLPLAASPTIQKAGGE
jgi:hypothetical protein